MTTIWNGVPDVCARALPAIGDSVRIVMVARFAEPKDPAALLRAAAAIGDRCPPAEIVFVGSGPTLAATQSLARQLSLSERVVFLGDRDDVASILSSAHIFALSTKSEGLPLSIIEAMRAGLPVIASNVGGVPELVINGMTGLTIEPGDQSGLARALRQLIVDPELRSQMGVQGRRRYEVHFSCERMLKRTEQIYSEILTQPRAIGEAVARTVAGQRPLVLQLASRPFRPGSVNKY